MNEMPTLTLAQLEAWQACQEAVDACTGHWPTGEAPLTEVVATLVEAEQWDWLEWLLHHHPDLVPTWAEYERSVTPALAQYQRSVQHVWAEYKRSVQHVWAEYERVTQTALHDAAVSFLAQQQPVTSQVRDDGEKD